VLRWPTACAPLLMAGLVLAMLVEPAPALAQDSAPAPSPSLRQRFIDYWLTPDQQGRWWLERNAPERAAAHFDDALWRGAAHARAQQWQAAADAFAQLDSAAGWFNQAQMLARLGRYADAVAAYEEALTRAPGWPAALADQARVRSLIPAELEPTPGEVSATPGERAGKPAPRQPRSLSEHEVAELWLQRLDTSPAAFLRRKFALEAQALSASAPPAPDSPLTPTPASARAPAAQ
jgi:Ca-activated chloride channel family protein